MSSVDRYQQQLRVCRVRPVETKATAGDEQIDINIAFWQLSRFYKNKIISLSHTHTNKMKRHTHFRIRKSCATGSSRIIIFKFVSLCMSCG